MTIASVAAALGAGPFAGRVERDVSIAPFTTYRLGGPAALYLEPRDVDDLARLGSALRDTSKDEVAPPVLALGRGSNLVVSDRGFDGIVVRLGASFSWMEEAGAAGLRAGASTSLPLLANWAARRGLSGLEFAVSIPGSVGGGVRMNAGAHGSQIAGSLENVTIFDIARVEIQTLPAAALDLTYRGSNLTEDDLVVAARFHLRRDDAEAVRARMEGFRAHRAETQPGAAQNAGSVFKNPPGDSAGRLVEAAGLKGFRIGGAAVSGLHANFFIAEKGARAQDVFDLVARVRALVRDHSGVDLEPEVRFVGPFREPASAPAEGGG